ncbi:MAG: BamA/TamA family outer membrane protein [Flavitalea sp.]
MAEYYYKASRFKSWLMGSNYRDEWTTPVKVRTFDISTEKGGLKPVKRGGGFQSRSLRLEDKKGNEYVLRSIEKFPDKTLPEEFRQTFIKDAIVDGVSASYPYAALSVPLLATAAGVPHANPQVVYVPDDPALKQYRADFANGMYLFEEREPANVKKTYSSTDVFKQLQKDNDNTIDQQAVLNARLLDMFIMDFDRHEDQWRWGNEEKKKSKNKKFYPIPRDRDQPFFINNGFIPHALSQEWVLPKFQGFRAKARNINSFNFNARYFDRSFLNELTEKDWTIAIDNFLPKMSDALIDSAMNLQPAEIRGQRRGWIAETLKKRKTYFRNEMLHYYRFLQKEVDIVGSDKKEYFDVAVNNDGSVKVAMLKINKDGELTDSLYTRIFQKGATREIRLWARDGDDSVRISGSGKAGIKIRVIGGEGRDKFINETPTRVQYYDLSNEANTIEGKFRNRMSSDPSINDYNRKAYKYNIVAPLISAAFNPDDGVYLGASVKATRHGFRKEPHKITHFFRANKALATGAYAFRYRLDAVDVIGKTDIVAEADVKAPDNVQNFFGIGNQTEFVNEGDKKISYYRTRYNLIQGFALFRTNPVRHFSLLTGPVFQHYRIDEEENKGRFISQSDLPGIDSNTIYKRKSFLGWQFEANIDNRDNEMIPTRGMLWKNTARVVKGVNAYANDFAQLATDLSLYISFKVPADLVIAARVGGGINYGKYEFFQAQYLSGLENLRGFRKYRFAGDKMFYNNIDLRIRIADFRGYILPGSVGILGFHDIGRVWVKEEESGRWHNGYGGGIWLAPGKRYVVAACYGFSEDGGLPFVSLGFQF